MEVTKQDIDNANEARRQPDFDIICQCPVAYAANREFNRSDAHVSYSNCHTAENEILFHIPYRLFKWIEQWDKNLPVEPISVETIRSRNC